MKIRFSRSRVVPCRRTDRQADRQTDRHDEANNRFSQSCECVKKFLGQDLSLSSV